MADPSMSDEESCECPYSDPIICFVEGTRTDKMGCPSGAVYTERVWQGTKPPLHLSSNQPMISARTLDVTRAYLTGKMAPKRAEKPCPPPDMPKCFRRKIPDDDDDDNPTC